MKAKVQGIDPKVVYKTNFGKFTLLIPIGREINVLIIGKFLPRNAAKGPYRSNQISHF